MTHWKKSEWMSLDKVLHLVFGFLTTAFLGVEMMIFTAIVKEILDEIEYDGFDLKDIIATVLGGLVPLFLK